MKFPLIQLYTFNRSKPIVVVNHWENDKEVQWDYCDLEGLPPERVGSRGGSPSMNDLGKPAPGQRDNLPEVFVDTKGNKHFIEDIHTLRSSR